MKLIDRQILRELFGPFFFGVVAFTSVFFAGSYLLKLTEWVMNGMPILTALEIVILLLPQIVVYTLPMATLLAVLLGIGRLSGDSEVVALFAGGISLYRIAVPVFALGVVVSAGSVLLSEAVAPRAQARYQTLQAAVLKQISPSDQPFVVRDDATNSVIIVKGGMDVDSGILKDVTVMRFVDQTPVMVVYAARAVWVGMNDEAHRYQWRLYNGYWQSVNTPSPAIVTFDQTRTKEVEIQKTPDQFSLYQKSNLKGTDQLSFSELSRIIKYVKAHPDRPLEKIRELEVDRWNKLALPLSSLIFAMLAAPLGIKPSRSSSSVGFGLSILLIFVYWMVWHYTSSLAVGGNLVPAAGAFAADALGLATAVFLLKRAAK